MAWGGPPRFAVNPIADAGTEALMHDFYRWRIDHPGRSTAEALRHAQLTLLEGGSVDGPKPVSTARRRGGSETQSAEGVDSLPDFVADQDRPFAHPYYWAPFVVIGGWR